MNITQALVTEPPLIWLVRFAGLAFAALAAVWLVDFIKLTNHGKDRA
jgi:hypothetical protein